MLFLKKKLVLLISFVLLSACGEGDNIKEYKAPKAIIPERAFSSSHFIWHVPTQWAYRTPQNPLQMAIFIASNRNDTYLENPKEIATTSLTFIEGATFDLESNLYRWQQQLNLPPTPISSENIRSLKTNLGDVTLLKIQNIQANKGTHVAFHEMSEGILFIKMSGPLNTLHEHTENFIAFVTSFQKDEEL